MRFIKKLLIICTLFIVNGSVGADVNIATTTVNDFFVALQSGDIKALKKLVGKNFYKKKRQLLDNNNQYREFLQDWYQGATADVNLVSQESEMAYIMNLTINWPDRPSVSTHLLVSTRKNGKWKIIDEFSLSERLKTQVNP